MSTSVVTHCELVDRQLFGESSWCCAHQVQTVEIRLSIEDFKLTVGAMVTAETMPKFGDDWHH